MPSGRRLDLDVVGLRFGGRGIIGGAGSALGTRCQLARLALAGEASADGFAGQRRCFGRLPGGSWADAAARSKPANGNYAARQAGRGALCQPARQHVPPARARTAERTRAAGSKERPSWRRASAASDRPTISQKVMWSTWMSPCLFLCESQTVATSRYANSRFFAELISGRSNAPAG